MAPKQHDPKVEERPIGEDGLRLTDDERKFANESGGVDRLSALPMELLDLVAEMVNDEGSCKRLNRTCRVMHEVTNPIMWRTTIFWKPHAMRDILKGSDWERLIERKAFKYCKYLVVVTRFTTKQGLSEGPMFARKIEKSLSAGSFSHIEAVIILASTPDGRKQRQGLYVAFSSNCRFNHSSVIGLDSLTEYPLNVDHLEFCLPDLGEDSPPRVCQPLPLVGRKRLEATNRQCYMKLTQVSEDVVEKHLPAAMMVILGSLGMSYGLWDTESPRNPDGWPNVRRFKTTSTRKLERYHPPTVLLDGVTYSKAEVAMRTYAQALANDHRIATVAVEAHISWFTPALKPDRLKEQLQKLCEPLVAVYPEACRTVGHAVGGVYFLGHGHKRFYLDPETMEFVPLLEEDVKRAPATVRRTEGVD